MSSSSILIEFASRRLRDEDGSFSIWGKAILENYRSVANIAYLPALSWSRKKDLILFGVKAFSLLSESYKIKSHLVLKARDPKRLTRFPASFTYDLSAYKQVYAAIQNHDDAYIQILKKQIDSTFEKVQPIFFIANSTIDPIDRLWIRHANERGIKTICLQHGIYSQAIPWYAQEEDIVKKFIALDAGQAQIIAKNIHPSKIVSLGKNSNFQWSSNGKVLNICFVGEDLERYGYLDMKMLIIDVYKYLAKYLINNTNFKCFYKPHPSEVASYGIAELIPITFNVEQMDVFIGFTSSLLKDISTKNKMAIQILDDKIPCDNFYENGYCLSVNNCADLVDKIMEVLGGVVNVPCITNIKLDELIT